MTPSTAPAAPAPQAAAPAVSDVATPPAAETKTQPKPAEPARAPRGPDWWLMVKAFFRQGKRVASFAPSSRSMARKLLDGIDWTATKTIVELGAGTGPITAAMAKLA